MRAGGRRGRGTEKLAEKPGRGRLEARQSGQAPLQLEKQLLEGKGTMSRLRLYSLPSEPGLPTAPRIALPSVLDLGLHPEQLGMQIST